MRQLPLGVQLGVSLRFDTYHAGANREAVAALRELAGGARAAPLWLFGPAGSGKSHLLQAACAHATSSGLTAAWLPLRTVREEDPGLLAGFERLDMVAIDDIDAIAGDAGWERSLFTFYNELLERQGRLAAAAAAAPGAMPFGLPDLASRFAAARVYRLLPLDETDQAAALRRRAAYRGLDLPEETLVFLTRRAPRDFAALCRLLYELDLESLAAQRRLTVPFVRDWLARERD
jgi:DnaA family protein